MANQVPAPPYTPGFGRRPPVVAGRDALVDDVARVLEVGPEHPRFCRAILGSRGTGKTVLLDVIGEVAAKKLGWAVLHVQALQEESLVAVLLQRIPEAVRPWERFGRSSKDLQAQLNVGVGSASATVERGHNAGTGSAAAAFEDALGRVGQLRRRSRHRAAGHGGRGPNGTPGGPLGGCPRPPDGGGPSPATRGRRLRRARDLQGSPRRRRDLRQPPPGRRARQPGAERGAPGPGRAGGPPPRGLGRRGPRPVGAPLGRSSLLRAALRLARLGGGPGGSHDHPRPRQSRACVRPEPSWRASTKSPGAACGPRSATTWPPWPAWPARAAPG